MNQYDYRSCGPSLVAYTKASLLMENQYYDWLMELLALPVKEFERIQMEFMRYSPDWPLIDEEKGDGGNVVWELQYFLERVLGTGGEMIKYVEGLIP